MRGSLFWGIIVGVFALFVLIAVYPSTTAYFMQLTNIQEDFAPGTSDNLINAWRTWPVVFIGVSFALIFGQAIRRVYEEYYYR